jgi:hypothetical protein
VWGDGMGAYGSLLRYCAAAQFVYTLELLVRPPVVLAGCKTMRCTMGLIALFVSINNETCLHNVLPIANAILCGTLIMRRLCSRRMFPRADSSCPALAKRLEAVTSRPPRPPSTAQG